MYNYQYFSVSLYKHVTVSLFQCPELLDQFITVSIYYCISVSLYNISVLLYH